MPSVDYLQPLSDLNADAAFFAEVGSFNDTFDRFGAAGDDILATAGGALLNTPAGASLQAACAQKAKTGAKEGVIEAAKENWPWLIVGALVLSTAQFAVSSIGTAVLLGRRF